MDHEKKSCPPIPPPKHTEDLHSSVQLSAEEERRKKNRLAQRKHRQRVKSLSGELAKQSADISGDILSAEPGADINVAGQESSEDGKTAFAQSHTSKLLTDVAAIHKAKSRVDSVNCRVQDSRSAATDSPSKLKLQHVSSDVRSSTVGHKISETAVISPASLVLPSAAAICQTENVQPVEFDDMDLALPDFQTQLDEFLTDMTDLDDMQPPYPQSYSQQPKFGHQLTPMSLGVDVGDTHMSESSIAQSKARDLSSNHAKFVRMQARFEETDVFDPEDDYEDDYAQSTGNASVNSIDSCFERILEVVEEAGFASIDEMSATYYTARFAEDSVSFEAQSRSRSRFLQSFLQSLHTSTENWSSREVQGYRHQIVAAAESVYVNELAHARQRVLKREEQRHSQSTAKTREPRTTLVPTANAVNKKKIQKLWEAIVQFDTGAETKLKKRVYRDEMPELWSLLHQLTRKADLHQPQASQIILAFLVLLFESGSGTTTMSNRPDYARRRTTSN